MQESYSEYADARKKPSKYDPRPLEPNIIRTNRGEGLFMGGGTRYNYLG